MKPEELWFNLPDSHTLCRAGGNGPNHPSQLYAIKKYVKPHMSFLDYGSGSGTTWEALEELNLNLKYTGVDIIPKNTEWCKEHFKDTPAKWEVNTEIHKITQPDQSYDVVYSRHVVDHMRSFEEALDEHKRVAKKYVIVVLWYGMNDGEEHQIKNIIDNGKTYESEYTNSYSRKKILDYLSLDPEWKLIEFKEGVGEEVKGHDTVIVLKRR